MDKVLTDPTLITNFGVEVNWVHGSIEIEGTGLNICLIIVLCTEEN